MKDFFNYDTISKICKRTDKIDYTEQANKKSPNMAKNTSRKVQRQMKNGNKTLASLIYKQKGKGQLPNRKLGKHNEQAVHRQGKTS